MRKAVLTLILLLVMSVSLAAWLQPRREARLNLGAADNMLGSLLGDGRKVAADYFYVRADVYLHSGYYPSIFEEARKQEEAESDVSHPDDTNALDAGYMTAPKDWIESFHRHFEPTRHTHLSGDTVGEMLPWLKLSAELDPQRIQTYLVASYWLRENLGKVQEAKEFLRAGIRANPKSPALLYELGNLYLENLKDLARARNLFVAARQAWIEVELPKPLKTDNGEGERDVQLQRNILAGLVKVERDAHQPAQELDYLKELKEASPAPEEVQKQIDELQREMKKSQGQ
jgi:tetratricopeptide (TPR) repeat protein